MYPSSSPGHRQYFLGVKSSLPLLWLMVFPALIGGVLNINPVQAQGTPYIPPPITPPPLSPSENPFDPSLFPTDPLIPSGETLTPLQRRRLIEALDALEAEALVLDQAGQGDQAFEVRYRSLRGRQRLGDLAEVEALGRIGAIAWEQGRNQDVMAIGQRLEDLQLSLTKDKAMSPELLTAFAKAYGQLHSLDSAIAVYQQMRREAQQQGDYRRENQALSMLGELYLAKFNYPAAAEVYETLLAQTENSRNPNC